MPMNPALRKEWVRAGYNGEMGSAEVVPPPPSDTLRVYHLASADHAVNDIELRRLKVARFSDLNDPFELMGVNLREQILRGVVSAFKEEYNAHTGLLCFSANWTNPVLWSHYGEKHRGVCLGFDVNKAQLQGVHYEDARILRELSNEGNPLLLSEELQALLLTTKFKHWQYEAEHRMFVKLSDMNADGSMYFCPFNSHLKLAEVILGDRCRHSLDAIRQLVRRVRPEAVTIKARLAYKFFAVVPDEATVP